MDKLMTSDNAQVTLVHSLGIFIFRKSFHCLPEHVMTYIYICCTGKTKITSNTNNPLFGQYIGILNNSSDDICLMFGIQ